MFREDKGEGTSMMRFCVFLLIVFICLIMASVAFHMIWNTVYFKEIRWLEAAAFVGAIAAFVTGILFNKERQRKVEADERVQLQQIKESARQL